MNGEAYCRLYYKFKAEFPEVYADDHLLAAWVRLLYEADASWPIRPSLPRWIKTRVLDALVVCGLVIPDDDSYTVRGLDAERSRRSESARVGGLARARSATAKQTLRERSPTAQPRRDETSKDEHYDARDDLEAWLAVRFRVPTEGQRRFLDTYCQVFDVTGPARAARLIYANPGDPIDALKKDLAAFREERRQEAVKSEAPKPAPRRRASGFTGVNAELAKLLNQQYADEEGSAA